jgi:membrane protein implicated in regulation of membrane protease activity
MIVLKVLTIIAIVLVALFLLTLVIYFFNLDMKFAAVLIKPLTAYYNWSKNRREVKKKKEQDTQKE